MDTHAATGGIRLETLTGADLRAHLPDLARLRAAVFRDWPYLYEARAGYEANYQSAYATSPAAGLVLAWDGGQAIGAATCLPLADETDDVKAPFVERGLDPRRYFYFGESVLLAPYRGRGLGVAFFQRREAHATAAGDADFACFCAVQRPTDHPRRPPDAATLAAFWHKRGYAERPDLTCQMSWRDVGDPAATPKTMIFWTKPLRGTASP